MGFEVGRTFRLEWPETHFLHDATIRMRSSSLGLTLSIRREMLWEELLTQLCAHVVEWNLELDGKPIPLDPTVVMESVSKPVLEAIAKAWQDASSGVTAPLDAASSDGQESQDTGELELSMPMESLSESPMS